MTQRIGILGSGIVSTVLANGFLRHGFEVIRGSREPAKLAEWKSKSGKLAAIGTFDVAAQFGEIVVLAVKGLAAEAVVRMAGPAHLFDKTVIDVTNPIADEPPEQGMLKFFTTPNESLMERLQHMVPRANFVKAFSSVGNELMVNPDFGGTRGTMFICGNSVPAKKDVAAILDQFGWEAADLGRVESARAIEPLCQLWCVQGWASGRWNHAFHLLRTPSQAPAQRRITREMPARQRRDSGALQHGPVA